MRGSVSRIKAANLFIQRWRGQVQRILILDGVSNKKCSIGRIAAIQVMDQMRRELLRRLDREVREDIAHCEEYAENANLSGPLGRFKEDLDLVQTIAQRDTFSQVRHQHESTDTVLRRMVASLNDALAELERAPAA